MDTQNNWKATPCYMTMFYIKFLLICVVISVTFLTEERGNIHAFRVKVEESQVLTVFPVKKQANTVKWMRLRKPRLHIKCVLCPPGQEPSNPCSSISEAIVLCRPCPSSSYSTRRSSSPCTPCSRCGHGKVAMRNCTPWYDTICQSCLTDFYFEKEHSSCLPCSRCCGDSKDVREDDCITQGSQHHCSYRSHKRCHGERRNITNREEMEFERSVIESVPTEAFSTRVPTEITSPNVFIATTNWTFPSNHSRNSKINLVYAKEQYILILIIIATITVTIMMIMIIIILTRRKRYSLKKSKTKSCIPVRITKQKSRSEMCKNDQSDELEDWARQDIKNGNYSFKCGVVVRYDVSSKLDGTQNLIVEVLVDSVYLHLKNLATNQIFVSPIFKFYSQGTQFEKPVEVCLPHSALIKSSSQNWDIDVLYVDEREGKEGKWRKVESEINVNWNEVTFKTNTLLTYAVVAKPRENAKKRMQLAVFAMRRMLSDRFEMALYLFDDIESSLQCIIKTNQSKGWTMIGSLYAVFVDCHHPISIQVEDLQEPWSLVYLKREATTSMNEMLKDSYFNVPRYRVMFRRSKRNAKKFSCNLRVDIGGMETIIPVVTFIPEELMCVFVEVHNEDPSTYDSKKLVRDIPYDVNYELCRKLDVPAKGRGQWRQLGHLLGLPEDRVEECSREYATLDGSPSMALMELICAMRPKTTVRELAESLKKLDRCDALSALKNLKKYDC